MMKKFAVACTSLLLLVACQTDTTGSVDAATSLTVVGTDTLAFVPDTFTVPVGEEITVTFTAEAAVEHDFVIGDAAAHGTVGDAGHGDHGHGDHGDDHRENAADLHVAHADAGQTVTATFTINAPGSYAVYCSVPGHRESGMIATLTVTD